MWQINRFDSDFNENLFSVECLKSYMIENLDLFESGWRFYVNDKDVTEDAHALAENKSLTMMRPAEGGAVAGVIIAAATAISVVALMPKPEAPATSNRSQNSATNSLGARTNEFNIGGRIDDIWGRVNNHVPRLLQVPHVRFSDHVETENFAVYISQGKVAIDNIRDGATKFSSLPKGQFNAWWPGGNPNNGVDPDVIDGDGTKINRPLVNVTQSKELQPAELLPPNDLYANEQPEWSVTSSSTSATITMINYDEVGQDLTEFFSAGQNLELIECFVGVNVRLETFLYFDFAAGEFKPHYLYVFDSENLSGTYIINDVSSDSVTISADSFPDFQNQQLLTEVYALTASDGLDVSTEPNSLLQNLTFYTSNLNEITVDEIFYSPVVDDAFGAVIGPIKVKDFCDTISLNFVAQNGFYNVVNGVEEVASCNIDISVIPTDSLGNQLNSAALLNHAVTFSSNSNSRTRSAGVTVDIDNPYDHAVIYCRRTTNRIKAANAQAVDKVFWRDLYFYNEIGEQNYGNVTVAQVVIPHSIAAEGVKERQINMDCTRYIAPYIGNGNFGPEAPVETVAEVVTALALDPLNGRLTLDEIDADLFLDVQNQLISYYGNSDMVKVGYDIDSTKMRFQDTFSLFWDAVRCNAYSQGAAYRVFPNIARNFPSKQFTHRNKILGTDTKERLYDVEYDGVELTYRSNKTGQFETIIKHSDGLDSVNRKQIELSGATQEIQAETRANYELNIIKYQKYNFSFEADGISRLTVPGERVTNVDQTRIVKREDNTNIYNIYDGLVVSIDGLIAELSQPVTFEDGETHSIRFTNKKGELLEAIGCSKGATAYHVVLEETPSESLYTGYKMEKTNFTFAPDKERDGMDILILGTKAKQSKGLKTRQLTAINYSPLYYQND